MDRLEIKTILTEQYGEMVGIPEIAKFCGINPSTAKKLMAGTEGLDLGNRKKYLAGDVADAIMARAK